MAYAFQEKQDDVLGSQKDEEQQNNTMLTSTAGDLGAETFNAGASGQSVGQKDQARQPQQTKRELLSRNQGRAQNPFQFQQTRQALGQAKQGVQTERDTYMQNAVTPYQYGQQQQQAVKTYAREGGPAGQTPDWLAKYQQGVPTALPTFQSNVQTNFAPVNALKTDAGVRSFLRNPNDPESRSGEQAIDFSLLNADPTFNINREGVLRDYSDLLKLQDETVQNTPIEARKAQLAAAEAFKKGITGTLEGEMAGIQGEASAAEQAYDAQLAAMNSAENRNRILQDVTGQIAKEAPENLRGLIRNPMGTDYSKFFNPITGESTRAEDFLTEDQAGDFNRIASILGRGGSVAAKGRLAGQKVGDDALRFDRNAYRDMILNQAQRDYESMQQSPFAGTGAYDADMGSLPPLTPAAQPAPPPAASGAPLGSYERVLEQARRAPGVLRDSLFTGLPKINDVPGVSFLSDGGRVPGRAPMPGDHQANDVVDAKLSPGEIVIPRSMASDKESAKEFIDNMPFANTKALLKPKYNCGGKVGSYACGGKVPGYAEGGRVNAIEYTGGFDTPIPGVDEAKRKFDDYLTEKIVNPMAQAGYEDLGAALATIPSTAVEAFVPSSAGDIMMGAAPFNKTMSMFKVSKLPGADIRGNALKDIKKAQAQELLEKMSADDVDISQLPSSSEFSKLSKIFAAQKKKANESKMLETVQKKHSERVPFESSLHKEIFGERARLSDWVPAHWDLHELAAENMHIPEIKKAVERVEMMDAKAHGMGTLKYKVALNDAKQNLMETLQKHKKDLKFSDELEKKKKLRTLPTYRSEKITSNPTPRSEKRSTESEKFWNKNKGKQNKPDFYAIKPEKLYSFEGEVISGKELKSRLLDMSTGEFNVADWKEID